MNIAVKGLQEITIFKRKRKRGKKKTTTTHGNGSPDPRVRSICTVQRVAAVHAAAARQRSAATYSGTHGAAPRAPH